MQLVDPELVQGDNQLQQVVEVNEVISAEEAF